MNTIRNMFPEEIEKLKPLLRTAYQRIHEYQEQREDNREKIMREAIGKTLEILTLFKEHIPAYKQKYIELLGEHVQLQPYDLIICFDRAIYELHARVKSGQWASLPWSHTLRDMLNERQEIEEIPNTQIKEIFLASGKGVSRGTSEGLARIIKSKADLLKIKKGDILITPMTEPDFIKVAHLISGLVTDRGGMICHAAILAREFNIPCIVGCKDATKTISNGQWIRMDTVSGLIMGDDK